MYPKELIMMESMFLDIRSKEFEIDLDDEGLFEEDTLVLCLTGTLYSPSLICQLIVDAYRRERYLGLGQRMTYILR